MRPKEYKYTDSHEWVKVEGNVATIGITDFAVKQLTDLVFVELPPAGEEVEVGEPFGEVESVKAVEELISPINGKVIEVNDELPENLDLLGESPFEKGWMVKVEMSDTAPLDDLMSLEEYNKIAVE